MEPHILYSSALRHFQQNFFANEKHGLHFNLNSKLSVSYTTATGVTEQEITYKCI